MPKFKVCLTRPSSGTCYRKPLISYVMCSVFRPMGVIGEGVIPMAFVGFMVLLLFLLRYVSIKLSPTAHTNIKEVPMKKNINCKGP